MASIGYSWRSYVRTGYRDSLLNESRLDPPLLVLEVVSPGELQQDRDYIAKRSQYQARGIPEYWIVDPEAQTILILELTGNTYAEVGSCSG